MMHDDQLKCHPGGSPPLCANTAANDYDCLFSLSKMKFYFSLAIRFWLPEPARILFLYFV